MGTHSILRLIAKSLRKNPIELWMRFDGYWDVKGDAICKDMTVLLARYPLEKINELLAALDVPENKAGMQDFDPSHLVPFIEGKTLYKNDAGVDHMYRYDIDFDEKVMRGMSVSYPKYEPEECRVLTFEQLAKGARISEQPDLSAAELAALMPKLTELK